MLRYSRWLSLAQAVGAALLEVFALLVRGLVFVLLVAGEVTVDILVPKLKLLQLVLVHREGRLVLPLLVADAENLAQVQARLLLRVLGRYASRRLQEPSLLLASGPLSASLHRARPVLVLALQGMLRKLRRARASLVLAIVGLKVLRVLEHVQRGQLVGIRDELWLLHLGDILSLR